MSSFTNVFQLLDSVEFSIGDANDDADVLPPNALWKGASDRGIDLRRDQRQTLRKLIERERQGGSIL